MQSTFSHIQFNVRAENVPFYAELLGFLGWQTLFAGEGFLGVAGKHGESFWFVGQVKDVANDYDGPGVNHIAIGAEAQADVDAAAAYLTERGVELLFETPRHRPDFPQGEGRTYYQIMFESPDRILFEFVYVGPIAA
jgi:catechol 2,3-dioxygenase-like lactoylglutathione lyase family enzyme